MSSIKLQRVCWGNIVSAGLFRNDYINLKDAYLNPRKFSCGYLQEKSSLDFDIVGYHFNPLPSFLSNKSHNTNLAS